MNVKIPKKSELKKTPIKLGKNKKYVYIDFTDTNFPARLKQGREEIANFLKEKCDELGIEDFSKFINEKITVEKLNEFHKIDDFIKNKIDFIFSYNASFSAFGIAPCIWITKKGEFYFDNFLNGLLPLIQEKFGVKLEPINNLRQKESFRKGVK